MSREIAAMLVEQRLAQLEKLPYSQLVRMLDQSTSLMESGPDGKSYQIEIQVFWDSKRGSSLRVLVAVDGGGVSAVKPVCGDFIASPEKPEGSTPSDF